MFLPVSSHVIQTLLLVYFYPLSHMYVFIMLQLKIHNIWIEFFKMKDFSLQAWIIEILTTATENP